MSYQYQVIVIGSGSAGREACLAAAKSGKRTLLVEEKSLGGASFHRGSYAVRALRACATNFNQTEKRPKVGASLDLMETNWADWRSAQRRNSRRLTVEFNEAIDRENVQLRFGRATLIGPNEISITDPQGLNQRITSNHIIIATGSRPSIPSQPESGVLNSDDLLKQPTSPRHLFVIGGGYIGCEIASIYRDLGARVTIAEAKSRLLPNWDPVAGQYFQNALEAACVEVLLNEHVVVPSLRPGEPPAYTLNSGTVIQPDITLLATGRRPNSDELGLETVGLPGGGWIQVNEHMQTKLDSIYAIGDVNGISLLDSIATAQANVAIQTILGAPISFDKRCFPQFLHTEPPIASIGRTEEEAEAFGLPTEALTWSGSLFNDDDFTTVEHMVIKCIIDSKSDLVLGCIAVGSRAAEIINLVSTAMANGQSAHEIVNLSAVHPRATEALIKTLQQRLGHGR
jgi:pyruvate/2-oxoglutarate dehydrogenase complex dihydrolipoamide dehydrogenase (E3) component